MNLPTVKYRILRVIWHFDLYHTQAYRHNKITRELIAPYNPYYNGVEKLKNRSIEESVKDIMHDLEFLFFYGLKDH